mmetsp:Transcript_2907/g.6821  ORF Transcript_2907/g.6821 Transcript_2907/m.6821 type:complete len:217 (-) Transcript_2907:84-734(-)
MTENDLDTCHKDSGSENECPSVIFIRVVERICTNNEFNSSKIIGENEIEKLKKGATAIQCSSSEQLTPDLFESLQRSAFRLWNYCVNEYNVEFHKAKYDNEHSTTESDAKRVDEKNIFFQHVEARSAASRILYSLFSSGKSAHRDPLFTSQNLATAAKSLLQVRDKKLSLLLFVRYCTRERKYLKVLSSSSRQPLSAPFYLVYFRVVLQLILVFGT